MARLHEYQGKVILAANRFKTPRGRSAWMRRFLSALRAMGDPFLPELPSG